MIGHLNGCMLLGFRNENKNERLELFHCPEPWRRKKKENEYNYYWNIDEMRRQNVATKKLRNRDT